MAAKKFKTNLHVDKNIIALLSTSTYQKSFSSAIRELVSNAYDADSLSVFITISKDYKEIEILDDGNGMTSTEFDKYLTIAGTKSSATHTRKYKRKRIGQFGVGFLSIFPFCKSLEIATTVENSDEVLFATIPAIDYQEGGNHFVENIPIYGNIIEDKSQKLKHYTRIRLINPTHAIKQYFTRTDTKKRDSILTKEPYEKFKWELQEDLPISFDPKKKSFQFSKYDEPIEISIFLNKERLYRNELCANVLESGNKTISGIKCSYIFTTNYKSILPQEARGIKRRVNNVGIGGRTDFGLKRDRGFSRLHWLEGEVHFSEEIKGSLTLSRDEFVSSPLVDELNDFFASKLKNWAYYVEDVAEAEKAIETTIKGNKKGKGKAISKKEQIDGSVGKLKDKGFEVISVKQTDTSSQSNKNPISVDKANKKIFITESVEYEEDYIKILNKKYLVEYSNGFSDSETPCVLKGNTVEINSKYKLFKSKSHGKLFEKIHIYLLIAGKNNKTAAEMYEYIIENFTSEFGDFT